jgi:hypothetical protein
MQNKDKIKNYIIAPWKGWKYSDIWGQIKQIKNLFRNELRASRYQGMFAIIPNSIFCLPVCYPKF